MLENYPEEIGPFADSFISDRALIWEKMVAIFQGLDALADLMPAKKHRDRRLGFRIIYKSLLGDQKHRSHGGQYIE